MDKYGLKLLYRYEVSDIGEIFYEMRIIVLEAEDSEQAYEKALSYAKGELDEERMNYKGQKVKESLVDVMDCYLIFEEEDEVQEVYSTIFKNRTDVDEKTFINMFATGCTREEMIPLRYFSDPHQQKE